MYNNYVKKLYVSTRQILKKKKFSEQVSLSFLLTEEETEAREINLLKSTYPANAGWFAPRPPEDWTGL